MARFAMWVCGLRLLVSHTLTHLCSSLLRMVCGPIVTGAVSLLGWMFLHGNWKSSILEIVIGVLYTRM